MLKHDKYWNWNVKSGDLVSCDFIHIGGYFITPSGLKINQIYEVVNTQATPSGIVVTNRTTGEIFVGDHSWFTEIRESRKLKLEKLNNFFS